MGEENSSSAGRTEPAWRQKMWRYLLYKVLRYFIFIRRITLNWSLRQQNSSKLLCGWLFLNITCGFLFNLSFVSCSERVTCEIFSINIVKMWFLAPCVWICVIYEYWLECWCLNFKWVIICVHLMILAQPLERQNMNIKLASLLRFTCSLRVQLSTSL